MTPGRVRSEEPEEPGREQEEDTRSNSWTAEERAALIDARHHRDSQEPTADHPIEPEPEEPKKRWPIVVAVAAVLAVIAGVVASAFAFPIFTVGTIEVQGTTQLDNEQVLEASGLEEGANLVRVDTNAAARGVVALPRVREATVSRSLPNTVVVEVVERRVVAFLDEPEGPVLIDEQGEPFSDGAPPESAIRVEAISKDDAELLEGAVAIAAALPDGVAKNVDHVSAQSESTYTLYMKDGREIFWGLAEDNHNKAIAVEAIVQREGQRWDVSNPQLVTQR